MKKIITFITIFILSFGVVGCEDSKNVETQQNNKTNESEREINKYTEEEYKALCEKIDYKTLARNPDANIGKKVYGTGEIVQVVEEDGEYAIFRIDITPVMNYDDTEVLYYEDTILAYTYSYDANNRLLEDDIIDFWGIANGNYTYENVLGSNTTVPSVQIDYFTLKN